ncbi:MAG: FAD-binding oxidoreductase [Alphaproteobacteria bacterium]
MNHSLGESLARVVGREHLLEDAETRAGYERDWTGRFGGRAAFVVRPADAAQVASVVQVCAGAGVAIVPQGGNSGLVGGGVPRGGEVLLSLRRLSGVDLVDGGACGVVTGAGATLAAVQRAASSAGFAFGVDIGPRDSCTIGGMIATNAGGMHVVRHGAMAAQVIGVEAVLADGSLVGRVPALPKDNAGYHLGAMLSGSEGTLGVVVRAHLRLVPADRERAAALVGLADAERAVSAVTGLRRALPSLSAIEILFPEALELAAAHVGAKAPLPPGCEVALLVECAGASGVARELAGGVDLLGDLVAGSVFAEGASVARLWRLREAVPEALAREGVPHKMDVSLPLARIPAFAREARSLVASLAPGARTVLFGHAADGNLHVNVLGLPPDDDTVDDAVLDLAARSGGSIAAEHGIGVAKVAALARVGRAADLAAMKALKRAFDPRGILNPGAVLPV